LKRAQHSFKCAQIGTLPLVAAITMIRCLSTWTGHRNQIREALQAQQRERDWSGWPCAASAQSPALNIFPGRADELTARSIRAGHPF
jgi:hypothetical protein